MISVADEGKFAASAGSSQCLPCEFGKSQRQQGASECGDCEAGRYASGKGGLDCAFCDEGKITNRSGLAACTSCSPGRFQPERGGSVCIDCLPGEFANKAGASSCFGERAGFVCDVRVDASHACCYASSLRLNCHRKPRTQLWIVFCCVRSVLPRFVRQHHAQQRGLRAVRPGLRAARTRSVDVQPLPSDHLCHVWRLNRL